jgi:hypothetical protein
MAADFYPAEPCVCTHAGERHEDGLFLELAWCTAPGCDCMIYWPMSRKAEFERRRAFVQAIKDIDPGVWPVPILALGSSHSAA